MSTPAVTSPLPYQASPRALAHATIGAVAGAAAILILFVLPAEWGIDPTGVGKALGLTRMASGAAEEDNGADTPTPEAAARTIIVRPQVKDNIQAQAPRRADEKTLTLPPHSGVEVKAHMVKGDHLIFDWRSTGPVRMDMHGEPKNGKEGEFSTYWKQKNMTQAQGQFTAPYEGTHGWYWRNGGETPVTITLHTAGFYKDLFEPAVE